MTVPYNAKVSTANFGTFFKLLVRWRGSLYKLLWADFLLFILLYYTLSLVYRFALWGEHKKRFESLALYCRMYSDMIPVAFILGFYVTIVVKRWWEQYLKIPWPDRMALYVTANLHGHDERGRLMRRTIMRYLCLSYVITMASISPPVRKRFPTFQHKTEAGFMVASEQKILEEMKTPHNKYFVPLIWATSLVTRARKEGRIKDDFATKTLIDEINEFRGALGTLFVYDYMCIPLVYTQVVTIAVYTYFLSSLLGRQFLTPDRTPPGNLIGQTHHIDFYVPVFTFLQFFFYMGWLKVAETMVNPFGDDDDDFEINETIDRNLQVSYLVVDEMHQEHPELIRDQYWDDVEFELPYTVASEKYRTGSPHLGSAMDLRFGSRTSQFTRLTSVMEGQPIDINSPQKNHHLAGFPHDKAVSSPGRQNFFRRFMKQRSTSVLEKSSKASSQASVESVGVQTPVVPMHGEVFEMSDLDLAKEEAGQINPFNFNNPRMGKHRISGSIADSSELEPLTSAPLLKMGCGDPDIGSAGDLDLDDSLEVVEVESIQLDNLDLADGPKVKRKLKDEKTK